jgi:hypothetical protein
VLESNDSGGLINMFKRLFTLAALAAVFAAVWSTTGWSSRSLGSGFHPTVSATLSGAEESPRVTASGSGSVRITLNPNAGKACWRFTVNGLRAPLTANVLRAPRGKVGPSVIRLGALYTRDGCTRASATAIRAVGENPGRFYVNIQSRKFLNGAIRGQLHP